MKIAQYHPIQHPITTETFLEQPTKESSQETTSQQQNDTSTTDHEGLLLRKQLADITVILKMALNNEFARALELCAERCALTLEQTDLKAALDSINHTFEISSQKKRKTSTASMVMRLIYRPNYNDYTDEQIHAELINSESLLLLSLISFLADQSIICFVRGAFRIRTCYQRYKECIFIMEKRTNWSSLEAKEHFESGVRMGHGIFNMLMSYLPRRILRLLEYVGFSGNRSLGIDELERSINLKDGLRSVFSNLVILTYHTYIENLFGLGNYDLDKVRELDQELGRDFPKSAFHYLFLGRYHQMRGNLDEAIESFELCIDSQDDWKQFHSICHWEMMWCYCFQQNWVKAAHYSDLLRRQSRWSPASYTYIYGTFLYTKLIEDLENGLCLVESQEYNERMKEIREVMESVPGLRVRIAGKTIPAEKFAITKSIKFCQQNNRLTLPAIEYLYIWNVFNLLKNNPKCAKEYLMLTNSEIERLDKEEKNLSQEQNNSIDNKTKINFQDDKALLLLLKGLCLKYLSRMPEAESCFMRVLESEQDIQEDKFLIPHSATELALIKLSEKQYEQSRSFVRMARDDYTGYLLESIVHFRLHSALRCIKLEQQEVELTSSSFSSSNSVENSSVGGSSSNENGEDQ